MKIESKRCRHPHDVDEYLNSFETFLKDWTISGEGPYLVTARYDDIEKRKYERWMNGEDNIIVKPVPKMSRGL